MPLSSLDAGRAICQFGNWKISNLRLHKILYIAHATYMVTHDGELLINEDFHAWKYGPVEPELYSKAKIFIRDDIKEYFWKAESASKPEIQNPMIRHIKEVTINIEELQLSTAALVVATHAEGGAWSTHYKVNVPYIVIPNEDILKEYKSYENVRGDE